MRKLSLWAGAAMFAAFGIQPASADIVVGFITSQTGPTASLGIPYAKGLEAGKAYASEVGGEKIRVVTLDDASDPSNASRLARKLVEEEKVDVLMGTAGTPATTAIAAVATELKVPMIAVSPVTSLPKSDTPWAVTVVQPPPEMVAIVVDYIAKTGVKNLGYIGFSDAWGDLVYNSSKATGEPLGVTLTTNERYARADTSVSAQVLKIVASKPDAVIVGGSGAGGALPYIALRERGYQGPIYGTPSMMNPDFVRVAGPAGEGTICSTGPVTVLSQLPDDHPNKKMGEAYQAAYAKANGGPATDGFSAYSFDAWVVLLDSAKRALQSAKPGTAQFHEALRAAIFSTKDVVGTHGVYNFKPGSLFGDDRKALVLVKLQQGKWMYLKQ